MYFKIALSFLSMLCLSVRPWLRRTRVAFLTLNPWGLLLTLGGVLSILILGIFTLFNLSYWYFWAGLLHFCTSLLVPALQDTHLRLPAPFTCDSPASDLAVSGPVFTQPPINCMRFQTSELKNNNRSLSERLAALSKSAPEEDFRKLF